MKNVNFGGNDLIPNYLFVPDEKGVESIWHFFAFYLYYEVVDNDMTLSDDDMFMDYKPVNITESDDE